MSTPARDTAGAGVGVITLLLLSACGGGSAGPAADGSNGPSAVAVSATDTACDVDTAELAAGTHQFTVTNAGSSITEFYVYAEGDRIMGEVENIAPGVARSLLVELPAGDYQTACKPGMTGDGIRSTLTVTGESVQLSNDQALATAVSDYSRYVNSQAVAFQEQTRAFVTAIKAGDLVQAQALYPVARTYYERIEPVASSFGDLDPKIDARENDVEPGDTWTGFHLLERDLWLTADISASGPAADQLTTDVDELVTRVQAIQLQPLDLANGALALLDEIASGKITGEEDRYSHTDLWDFQANLDGSQAAITSLRPVIAEADPDLATALDQAFAATQAELAQFASGDGFVLYTTLTPQQVQGLSDSLNALAAQVSQVPAVVAG